MNGEHKMKYSLILLAAGQGKRMNAGINKIFIELHHKTILAHTLLTFEQDKSCEKVVIVGHPDELETIQKMVKAERSQKVFAVISGGEERQDSVKRGLAHIDEEEIVFIHDAARPFIKQKQIHGLLDGVRKTGAAILAVPVKDTIKMVHNHLVNKTMDRSELMAVQTPQAFHAKLIKKAHLEAERSGKLGTDDASLVEWIGEEVEVVEGDYLNIKITTKEDLLFAEAILKIESGSS